MDDVIQGVFDLAYEALEKKPKYVTINLEKVNELAEKMKEDGIPEFYEDKSEYHTGIHIDILKELVASSINYCYWYGAHDIRPNSVSSTSMYQDVETVFEGVKHQALNFEMRMRELIELLSKHRYPLLEERKRHLLELCEDRKAEVFTAMVQNKSLSSVNLFNELVSRFQGFSSDLFLKRASLFFIQLYRKFGWYKDDLMTILHVPADYQVPKILKYFGCIEYDDILSKKINQMKLIKKHSLEEIQIRAATIKVCTELQNKTGWTIADVDTYLWGMRKLTDDPFHLTITSDY